MIAPLVVELSVENIVALTATVGLALAFALKDYVSCVIAGVVTIIENTYQRATGSKWTATHLASW